MTYKCCRGIDFSNNDRTNFAAPSFEDALSGYDAYRLLHFRLADRLILRLMQT